MTEQVMATDLFVDDYFEHYGVKGMKWGRRKTGGQIRTARQSVAKKKSELDRSQDKVDSTAKGTKARESAEKSHAKLKADFLNSPDRATSARMTKGEAVILALFVSPVGAAAAYGVTRARSAHIQSRQASGGYNKKR